MTLRTAPAETDRYRYYLDEIFLGGAGPNGPTLREFLNYACIIGDDEGIHNDAERAAEFAETCGDYRVHVQNAMHLELTVAQARELHDACMSAWEYAAENNYGADDEPDEEARQFGRYGELMLSALTRPWQDLTLTDDGSHGFERLEG